MPKPKNPGPPLPRCILCGNFMPADTGYDVCRACRAKCSNAAGVGNHQYAESLYGGCCCMFCGADLSEVFRGLDGED